MSIPTVTREDVLGALKQFDEEYRNSNDWRGWEQKDNFRYAIAHEGRTYPVKLIIELATGHPRQYFSGGDRANSYVKDLGFAVDELEQAQTSGHLPWDEAIYWAKRFYALEEFDEHERSFKLKYAEQANDARHAMNTDDERLIDLLKSSFNGRWHAVNRYTAGPFKTWCEGNPELAKQALSTIWDEFALPPERIRDFLRLVPKEAAPSQRLTLAVFLQSALGPEYVYNFRVQSLNHAFKLTKFPNWPDDADDADRYDHFIRFLDIFITESDKRNLKLRDRLDAQGLSWMLTRWDAPEHWPKEDREAFRSFKKGVSLLDPTALTPVVPDTPPGTNIACLAERLSIDVEFIEQVGQLLDEKRQLIFYGPPGTGKTYLAMALAEFFAMNPEDREEDGMVKIVQFHPSYAYEDFVQGFRPVQGANGNARFALLDGPLLEIANAAVSQPEVKHVLIIDEINRGNVAKVLGELYFLLEYRDEAISLQYSSDEFSLPKNLWIIGTMNTADRSIALIDAALRRRFYFVPFFPDEPPIEGLLRRWLERENSGMLWVADVVDKANELLGDRHGAIGPSYFMKDNLDEAWVERIWKYAVMPYLAEQFFGEDERLEEFELNRLRGLTEGPDETDSDALSQS